MASTPLGADHVVTGFLGAMLLGILSGYVAKCVLKGCRSVRCADAGYADHDYSIVSSVIVGMLYLYVLIGPIGLP